MTFIAAAGALASNLLAGGIEAGIDGLIESAGSVAEQGLSAVEGVVNGREQHFTRSRANAKRKREAEARGVASNAEDPTADNQGNSVNDNSVEGLEPANKRDKRDVGELDGITEGELNELEEDFPMGDDGNGANARVASSGGGGGRSTGGGSSNAPIPWTTPYGLGPTPIKHRTKSHKFYKKGFMCLKAFGKYGGVNQQDRHRTWASAFTNTANADVCNYCFDDVVGPDGTWTSNRVTPGADVMRSIKRQTYQICDVQQRCHIIPDGSTFVVTDAGSNQRAMDFIQAQRCTSLKFRNVRTTLHSILEGYAGPNAERNFPDAVLMSWEDPYVPDTSAGVFQANVSHFDRGKPLIHAEQSPGDVGIADDWEMIMNKMPLMNKAGAQCLQVGNEDIVIKHKLVWDTRLELRARSIDNHRYQTEMHADYETPWLAKPAQWNAQVATARWLTQMMAKENTFHNKELGMNMGSEEWGALDNDPDFEKQVVMFPYTTEFEVSFGGRWFDKIPIDLYSDADTPMERRDIIPTETSLEEETPKAKKKRRLEERMTTNNSRHSRLMDDITERD